MKKILALFFSVVFALSFTVSAFGSDLTLSSPDFLESESSAAENPGTSEDNILLDFVLNDIKSDLEVLAEEVEGVKNEVDILSESDNVDVPSGEDVTSEEETELNPELVGEGDMMFTNVSLYSVAPIGPEDTTGLKSIILELIGPYDPVVVEYEYVNNNNYSSYLREVLPDYPWFASCAIFGLVVYCVFRIGGAMLGNL